MTDIEKFRQLHHRDEILHIGNVWDVNSALVFESKNYKALGTSSLAIANSLGYEDGEELSFDELFLIVKQIISKVNTLVSVDIEGGYSRDVNKIVENIQRLSEIGVVGINIEDSIVENKQRVILDKEKFSNILKEIRALLDKKNIDIFINVRIDCFILGLQNPLEQTLERLDLYKDCGVDGIFIPTVEKIEHIIEIQKATSLPINVMCMPELPSIKKLEDLGIKRVSQGPFIYNKLINTFENKLDEIEEDSNYKSLF